MLWAIPILALLALGAAAMDPIYCTESCGDTPILFPFGIEKGCGDPDPFFRLQCNNRTLTWISSIDYQEELIYFKDCNSLRQYCTGADQYCSLEMPKVCPSKDLVSTVSIPWLVNPELENDCHNCTTKFPNATCSYDPNENNEFQCCLPTGCHNATEVLNAAEPNSSRAKNRAAIVGGAVGGSAALGLAALAVTCCIARRRRALKSRNLILGGPSNSFNAHKQQHQVLSKSGRILYSNNTSSYTNSSTSDGSSFYAVDMTSSGSSAKADVGGGSNSTRFTYQELREATNNFSEDGRLGDGGFGTVYKGKLRDGRAVAVKKLNPWNAQGKYQFDNEVTILSRVTHPHLVRLYGCCIEQELLLVYEFVANGTLADHLHDNPSDFLPWDARLTVAIQCAEALAFLHTNVCYHRDVKSTNILLDDRYHCKVGDFGLSRLVPSLELTHITTAPQGTPGYLDPDYHQSYQLTDKSDVYSLGVVLMELISSQRAVDMSRDRKEINLASLAVSRIQCGELDKLIDPKLGVATDPVRAWMVECVAELGFSSLATEKEDRPSMKEVEARLRAIEEEGKQRYLGQMAAIRSGSGGSDGPTVGSQRIRSKPRSSPTSVQAQWPSNSTSSNDSVASL